MHILFLTDNFPPEVNAPASRTFEHGREWVRKGHRVTVVTCAPNFPRGRVYPGYRNRLWQEEEMAGIRVIRVWSYITANEGFLRRILDYLSFMLAATLASVFVRQVDLVIGTSPQFFTACAACAVSLLKRIPFVFEVRDLWPESITAVGAMRDSAVIRWLEGVEKFLYWQAALIITVTQGLAERLVQRGVARAKVGVVTNGVDTLRFAPQAKDEQLLAELGLSGRYVAGYVGTLGMAHHLETILDAAERGLEQDGQVPLHFLLLGDGARKAALKEEARQRGLDNVTFLDSVAKDQVVRYWSLLDVSIIHLRKMALFQAAIPSKLFESMAMGLPVLLGVAGEAARIVREEGVGEVFEPENATELLASLRQLRDCRSTYEQYRSNCLDAAKKYDRAILAGKMLDRLTSLGAHDRS